MLTQRIIVLLALCFIVISIPVSYLVNTYRMIHLINPSDSLTNFIKYLPFVFFSVVLLYDVFAILRLANNNKTKDAAKHSVVLMVLLMVAFTVLLLTFNIGIRYVL